MKKSFKILSTYPFSKEKLRTLCPSLNTPLYVKSTKDFQNQLRTADALICLLTDSIDEDFLKKAPNLKVIGNHAVGVNNIDLQACKKRGIKVCNTPDCLTRSTAELTLTLLFATAKRVTEGEVLSRSGKFRGWTPDLLLGHELLGKNAVLVGAGRIGKETAKLFRALGISVEFITRKDSHKKIEQKLKRAQILSLHCPLTPQTHHWLDRKKLSLLPRDAIVINTSRGPVIDEQALIEILEKRKIFGAGLDVFEHEPEIPRKLRKLANCVLLPHIGSATHEARTAMLKLVLTGTRDLLLGKKPKNQVFF